MMALAMFSGLSFECIVFGWVLKYDCSHAGSILEPSFFWGGGQELLGTPNLHCRLIWRAHKGIEI